MKRKWYKTKRFWIILIVVLFASAINTARQEANYTNSSTSVLDEKINTLKMYDSIASTGHIVLNMTDIQVKRAWGRPKEINRTVTRFGTHEQWIYGSTYLYFDNGILTSFQDER